VTTSFSGGGRGARRAGFVSFRGRLVRAPDVDEAALGRILASEVPDLIRDRTRAGRDVDDRPFAPYASKTDESGTPDLDKSGRMLGSLRGQALTRGDKTEVVVSVSPEHERQALALHNGARGARPRRFLGLSPRDLTELVRRLARRRFEWLRIRRARGRDALG
jgi:hypothetical protein